MRMLNRQTLIFFGLVLFGLYQDHNFAANKQEPKSRECSGDIWRVHPVDWVVASHVNIDRPTASRVLVNLLHQCIQEITYPSTPMDVTHKIQRNFGCVVIHRSTSTGFPRQILGNPPDD